MSEATKYVDLLQLTPTQQHAIDQLLSGNNDRETAEAVGVHRTTVSRWRLYHPAFRAELKNRRLELASSGADRLHSMISTALDAVQAELTGGKNPLAAAMLVLKMAGLEKWRYSGGATSAEQLLDLQIQSEIRKRDRERLHSDWDDSLSTPISDKTESERAEIEKVVIARIREQVRETEVSADPRKSKPKTKTGKNRAGKQNNQTS